MKNEAACPGVQVMHDKDIPIFNLKSAELYL